MPNDRGGVHTLEPSNSSVNIDATAAAAAISAGFTTGIVQAAQQTTTSASSVQTALSNGIQAAVLSAITQAGVALQGPAIPQSTGINTTSSTNKKTVGAAGVITGFVSQVVDIHDTDFGGNSTTLTNGMINAILTAAIQNGGSPYAFCKWPRPLVKLSDISLATSAATPL